MRLSHTKDLLGIFKNEFVLVISWHKLDCILFIVCAQDIRRIFVKADRPIRIDSKLLMIIVRIFAMEDSIS